MPKYFSALGYCLEFSSPPTIMAPSSPTSVCILKPPSVSRTFWQCYLKSKCPSSSFMSLLRPLASFLPSVAAIIIKHAYFFYCLISPTRIKALPEQRFFLFCSLLFSPNVENSAWYIVESQQIFVVGILYRYCIWENIKVWPLVLRWWIKLTVIWKLLSAHGMNDCCNIIRCPEVIRKSEMTPLRLN